MLLVTFLSSQIVVTPYIRCNHFSLKTQPASGLLHGLAADNNLFHQPFFA